MKKVVLIIFYIFLSTMLNRNARAIEALQTKYFDFKIDTKIVPYQKIITTSFKYKLIGYKPEDFVVRPFLKRGIVHVFDKEKNKWIGQHDLWTNMPNLKEEFELKINLSGSSDLWFQIQNKIDSEIYETSKITIWGESIHDDYIKKLNKNIKSYVFNQEASLEKSTKTHQADTLKQEPKQMTVSLLNKVIKYIGEII